MEYTDIKKVGIAGSGIMGSSMAQVFAQKGYEVILFDISEKCLEKAKELITINQSSLIEGKILTKLEAEKAQEKITFTAEKKMLSDVDLLIEAIVEKVDIKQNFWHEMEQIIKKEAIFATNTSGLSITKIGAKLENKSRFAGMHWWNPPHIIPLIEVIRGKETSEATTDVLMKLIETIDKKPVLVKKDANGFIGNRLQFAVLREALNIVEQGIATPEDVDIALKYGPGFRYAALGAFETADLGGLDTFYYISSYLFNELSSTKEPSNVLKKFVDNNQLGVKTGSGFYDYSQGRDKEVMRERDEKFLKMLKYIHN